MEEETGGVVGHAPMSVIPEEDWDYAISQEDVLRVCKSEKDASVGFGGSDDSLNDEREKALEYLKGEMSDVKADEGRSKAVSTDVADAVEMVLPDLMEIFTGGEDVASFRPENADDIQQAKLETAWVNEVFFDQNDGFMLAYTGIRDALEIKTGLFKVWWQDDAHEEEVLEGKTEEEILMALEGGHEVVEETPNEQDPSLIDVKIRKVANYGCCKVSSINPDDFGVSEDTVRLQESPYCILRSRPRAYQLIKDGYDRDLVDMLPETGSDVDEEEKQSRDTVDESESLYGGTPEKDRRRVEIHEHWIHLDMNDDGNPQLMCVTTDANETFILDIQQKSRIGFAAGTPFIRTHRFYGQSIFDKLAQVQQIKTVLIRMLLDSGYFDLNKRYEVAMDKALPAKNGISQTIADLMNNKPNAVVRSKDGNAVRAIGAAFSSFDLLGALEFMKTVGEERSGIARNAMGLNPDTLHDTKGGMEKLFSAAQRRVRLIARVLAETLFKDTFMLIHATTREHGSQKQMLMFNDEYVPIDPSAMAARNRMTIGIGVGSGGREQEIMIMDKVLDIQREIIELQGGVEGPIVKLENVHNALTRFSERGGLKAPELYFSKPDPMAEKEKQPEPSPEMIKMQMEQQELDHKQKMEIRDREFEEKLAMRRAEFEEGLAIRRQQFEQHLAQAKAGLKLMTGHDGGDDGLGEYHMGGDLGT